MYDSSGKICGLQEHYWDGDKHIKKCMAGSKHGVFKPNIQFDPDKPLFIAEGFSDCAVLVEMGFQAIGKFNALHKLNKDFIRQFKRFKQVIIVSDTDECGRKGSQELANKLSAVKIIYPQTVHGVTQFYYNDIREMYLSEGKDKTKQWIEERIC
jgi:phage/plasmid primase-like uncharacterized protein